MKELLLVLVICGAALCDNCCPDNLIMRPGGYCGNLTRRVNMNCTAGHMLLKDVILDGTKLSTKDTPNYVFSEIPSDYCLGQMYRNANGTPSELIPVAVVCFENFEDTSKDYEISGILTIISAFFLIATFAVYLYMPQLRDLQGLCYMCMCISMAFGFLSLGTIQFSPNFQGEVCAIAGFLIYFWMMSTFFWMNIICVNMYRTIIDDSYLKKTLKKQFMLYSCYAWGGAVLFLIVALIANFTEGNHWKPGIGNASCWFAGRTETWIFFYGPISIIITSNVILFSMSSYTLWKHTIKRELNTINNLKYKFLLSLKLFLVMGITWIFEVVSFAHGKYHIIWKIMDTFNCLQGVVIFLLLVVLRKRAVQSLVSEGCCLQIMRPLSEKLSPHDDSDDQQMLSDDNVEVRLN